MPARLSTVDLGRIAGYCTQAMHSIPNQRSICMLRRGATFRAAALLVVAAAALCALGPGCGSAVDRESPAEILHSVKIPDPSVLGYVRADAAGVQNLANMIEQASFMFSFFPGMMVFGDSLPLDMVMKSLTLTAEDSHMILVLLDPEVFGAGAALHFIPKEDVSLVDLLDADPDYMRLSDSPPEFKLLRERSTAQEIGRAMRSVGIDLALPDRGEYANRFIVEEGDRDILVLPSYDAHHDVRAFLESTDYLSPWGDAGLVVNLDIERLTVAYAELLLSLDRSIRAIAAKMDAAFEQESDRKVVMTPGKLLMFGSVTALGGLGGMDAVRYVSSHPETGEAEVRILAEEDDGLEQIIRALETDGPEMVGYVPGNLVMQFRLDPEQAVELVAVGKEFYEESLELEPDSLLPFAEACRRYLAMTSGRHLSSLGGADEEVWWANFAALDPGAKESAVDAAVHDMWMELSALVGYETTVKELAGPGTARRYDVFSSGLLMVDSIQSDCLQMAVMHRAAAGLSDDGRPAPIAAKLFRLVKSLGLAADHAPDEAESNLFIKLSFVPQKDGIAPALGAFARIGIQGWGRMEGRELVIRFASG